jgi:hypothetical protein
MSDITIKIGGDSKDLQEEVKKVRKSIEGISASSEKGIGTSNIAFGSFIGSLASSATTAALSGLANLFGSISSAAIGFAKAAEEDNKSLNQLNIALAQTGNYTKESADKMAAYVDQLEKTSNFSGPAIAKTAAFVQQLSVLSGDALPRSTQATADFASAFGLDIESAAKIVGKALSGNVEALGKYGIELKSTGDKGKDAAAALDLLEQRFSGAALQSIQNFSGAQGQLENKIEDVGKAFFGQITTNSALVGSIQGVGVVFSEFENIINENKEGINSFVTDAILFLVDGITVAGDAIAFFVGLAGDIQAFSRFIDEAILASIQTFFELQAGVGTVAANIKEFFGGNADNIRRFVSQAENAVEGFKASRDANDAETAALMANTENKAKAITDFSEKAEEMVRNRITAAQEADQKETNSFLEQLNTRAEARTEDIALSTEEEEAKKEFNQLNTEENLAIIEESLGKEAALREQARTQELTKTGKYTAALKNLKAAQVKAEQENIFAIQKFEELSQKQRLANLQSSLGQISTLQNSSSKELFLLGKAAALSQATISGIQAVQVALASAPPPFNFAIAAAVGIAAAANVAKIAKENPPTGAFNGAYVGEGSGYKDDQPFMLSRGELIAPAKDFDQVVEGTARERGFVKRDELSKTNEGQASTQTLVIELQDRAGEFINLSQRQGRTLGIIGAT